MKGNEQVLVSLNDLLADELTAINQYVVHAEMCANWGYQKLHGVIMKRAIDEMKHAERLIERILFLDTKPTVSKLKEIQIADKVENQFQNDLNAELMAVRVYNLAIKTCIEVGDNGSREILDLILKDEEAHIDWLEAQLEQIKQIGIQTYLAMQIPPAQGA
ncbi:MAG: bacterioferritin [Bdellovibrionota bacterium]